jgi:hypothetical protein
MAKSSVGGRVGLAVFALVALAGIAGGAYYQADIGTYWRLQGWNSGAAEAFTKDWIRQAHAGAGAEALASGLLKPVQAGGKLTGIQKAGATGPVTVPIRRIVPAAEAKSVASRIKFKAGAYEIAVQYPNGKWAAFGVTRSNGKFQIASVPDDLTGEKPQPQPWD